MILTMICFAAMQMPSAADFFHGVPGTVRTYETKGGASDLVDTVGQLMDMGGVDVVPVTANGVTTYYRVQPDQVSVVAYDVKKPMVTPMPILRVGTGKVTWDFQGTTESGLSGERLLEHGEARLGGQRTVLGKKVDILTVKLIAAVGVGISGYTVEQTVVYGKGIGWIESTKKSKLGHGKTIESSYHIVKMETVKPTQ